MLNHLIIHSLVDPISWFVIPWLLLYFSSLMSDFIMKICTIHCFHLCNCAVFYITGRFLHWVCSAPAMFELADWLLSSVNMQSGPVVIRGLIGGRLSAVTDMMVDPFVPIDMGWFMNSISHKIYSFVVIMLSTYHGLCDLFILTRWPLGDFNLI